MRSVLLAILSGLLLILCFPRFDLGFLAWFALVPLLFAIKDRSLKSAFGLCFLTGTIFYIGIFYFFKLLEGVGWIEFILIGVLLLSCYFGLFGLALNFVSKKTKLPHIVTAPVLWVTLEYVRSHVGFMGYPWVFMGHSQYLNLPFIQISAFTGAYGVSFLIVMVNVAISDLIHDRRRAFKPTIATIIVLGISLVYGLSVITKEHEKDSVSITVIQGNIPRIIEWKPETLKQNFKKYIWLTKEALNNNNTSLIVWPENTILRSIKRNLFLSRTISALARETKTHILFGNAHHPKAGSGVSKEKRFSSAFLVSPRGRIEGQYNKIHLIPFAEYVPYKDFIPWPSRFITKTSNFTPGTKYTIFNLDGARFGVVICWENTFPELFRRFVRNGANFMVNITNEVLLGDTAAPYQFAAMSIFRAVENRISIIRCANTGISCFIDPHGKIVGRVHDHNNKETFVEGYLTKEMPLSHKRTFYTRYGDVFVYMNLITTVFMLTLCFFKSKYSATKALRL